MSKNTPSQSQATATPPASQPSVTTDATKERSNTGGKPKNPSGGPPATVQPKPQLTRAERRAIQEAQRATKEQKKTAQPPANKGREAAQTTEHPPTTTKPISATPRSNVEQTESVMSTVSRTNKSSASVNQTNPSSQVPVQTKTSKNKKQSNEDVTLFSHLVVYTRQSAMSQINTEFKALHPAIIRLGLQYAEKQIVGSNSRCIAFLSAIREMIDDYQSSSDPADASIFNKKDFNNELKLSITFLTKCRPMAVTMGTAVRFLKSHIYSLREEATNAEAKEHLNQVIQSFVHEKIELPGIAIAETYAITKITDGDVILIFGYSSLIMRILEVATKRNIRFRVIIVDSRPQNLGLKSAKKLLSLNVKCTYILINAVPSIISEVTKVLLGAHGLLGNGYVMSQIGTAQIALVAKTHNVPVLVCCETYKFSERVQTDSFVFNELGDPNDLIINSNSKNSKDLGNDGSTSTKLDLNMLNMNYDVTPPNFISAVITELGILPCTSVAVVIRMQNKQLDEIDGQDSQSHTKAKSQLNL